MKRNKDGRKERSKKKDGRKVRKMERKKGGRKKERWIE